MEQFIANFNDLQTKYNELFLLKNSIIMYKIIDYQLKFKKNLKWDNEKLVN